VEPLPHQITAVYAEMIPRQPLRFLLADDPGAGKTIMAGLLMRELLIRGDLHRCLVVCPGSLAAQWQDELFQKFHLPFEILTNDRIEAARTGNAFTEIPLLIVRLDKLSRNDDLQAKLAQTDWDLVICDEAHKMSASFFGGEVKETQRYKLGKLLGDITRHLLLMTATPHNGKEEDFQLFMALLDSDRFEGRFRGGTNTTDTSDLMRRLVKEDLLKFDGKPLFPERKAYTVGYRLSDLEQQLYHKVTEYVREEFNRADALDNNGRKGTVGFALTILQRRLASSPEAIYQSIHRRRERLQKRLQEEKEKPQRYEEHEDALWALCLSGSLDEEEFEDLTVEEQEATVEEVVDQATAARTVAELQAEIEQLTQIEQLALKVKRSGKDKKWEELSNLLQNEAELFDAHGHRRKLVLFTEHRDTLNYLADRIRTLIGRSEAVVMIHGGMGREQRKKAEESFKQDVTVQVLLATDAAGEGINLQRAHLMVNYDLPWNPNRLEQRFGRIHRIGQTEVCHLWNLVAEETREGEVYLTLLRKLDLEQKALGGKVFDVLGKAIAGKDLRDLLIEAIRYGDRPDIRAKLNQVVSDRLDQQRLRELLEERALARDTMDASRVQQIREDMDRAEARRLQPHFIAAFFLEAFANLGGTAKQREPKRYEITHVPAMIRSQDRQIGVREPILRSYERICFEKGLINVPGKPPAAFVCPGHPLLEAVTEIMLDRHRDLLKQGAVLVDENDFGEQVRALVYLEHSIQDASTDSSGKRRVVSRRMQYVEIWEPQRHEDHREVSNAGYAPYLNYRPLTVDERTLLEAQNALCPLCLCGSTLESQATKYAIAHLMPEHLQEVKQRKEDLVAKTIKAVKERLTREIYYWDKQAEQLKQQEAAGKVNAKINSAKARTRADELESRLQRRLTELEQERKLSPLPPVVVGGALVIPIGFLQRVQGKRQSEAELFARETKRVEMLAMQAVMVAEQVLGHEPQDVSREKCGYDIESRVPGTVDQPSRVRFIEVKGRIKGAESVTVTKNEILTALNKPENFVLALVQVPESADFPEGDAFKVSSPKGRYNVGNNGCVVRYVLNPFQKEPDFKADSVNYNWKELWGQGRNPG
jgi:superfamily II DNA or RNA helicase